jgi:hypothetical protein
MRGCFIFAMFSLRMCRPPRFARAASSQCAPQGEDDDQYSHDDEGCGPNSRIGQNQDKQSEDKINPMLPHVFNDFLMATFTYIPSHSYYNRAAACIPVNGRR